MQGATNPETWTSRALRNSPRLRSITARSPKRTSRQSRRQIAEGELRVLAGSGAEQLQEVQGLLLLQRVRVQRAQIGELGLNALPGRLPHLECGGAQRQTQ